MRRILQELRYNPALSWLCNIVAPCAGALLPFSLAPYGLWYLGIASAVILMLLIRGSTAKTGFIRSFLFGLGLYATGASWVYGAIHDFGFTSSTLAFVLTAIFVVGLAFVFSIPFFFFCRYLRFTRASSTLGFTACWVLGEWSRSWFLTGFPWLYIGYAHIDTWLAGWAPILGVFGVSFLAVISGVYIVDALKKLFQSHNRSVTEILLSAGLVCTVWIAGKFLHTLDWREHENEQLTSVAIVQPNIPLELKWNPLYLDDTLAILREASEKHWDKDIIVWPEAAIPLMYHDAQPFLDEMHNQAIATDTGLITGILYDDPTPGVYYNSIVGVGQVDGIYFKQRLVPFGEYVPMEKWLRGLIAFFNLPNSIIFPGPENQDILSFRGKKIAPSICYEIVYPDLVANLANDAAMLVTISNDAWFGASIGPVQHFQMAQMRALENQLYVVRSTNTGISGIIDPRGNITLLGKQFNKESIAQLELDLKPASTPFSRYKSWPVVIFSLLIALTVAFVGIKQHQMRLINLPD